MFVFLALKVSAEDYVRDVNIMLRRCGITLICSECRSAKGPFEKGGNWSVVRGPKQSVW